MAEAALEAAEPKRPANVSPDEPAVSLNVNGADTMLYPGSRGERVDGQWVRHLLFLELCGLAVR
jgi:hypothetical protein